MGAAAEAAGETDRVQGDGDRENIRVGCAGGSPLIHYITTNGIGNPWVGAEIQILRRQGIPITLHSMRASRQAYYGSEWAKQLDQGTRLLYPLPPARFAIGVLLAPLRFRGRLLSVMLNALFGERERLRNRIAGMAHVLVACHWAAMLRREDVSVIHSQWIHSCGTIGMYAAWLLGVPFSFTGHAADLFRDRVALRDKVRRADFIVCISSFHRDLYRKLGAADSKLHIVFCGIDVRQFAFRWRERRPGPVRILTVGRLVPKKGVGVLIDACKLLKERGLEFRCVIGSDGPLEGELREQVGRLGLESEVEILGKAIKQEQLPEFLASGDIFAQPCVWAKDGDVDGTPRTLMEAMACGLPAVSTRLAGIPDIIVDGESGLLVEPDNAAGLADALERLAKDEALSKRLAEGGRKRMEEMFQIDRCLERLAGLFRERLRGRVREAEPAPIVAGAGGEAA